MSNSLTLPASMQAPTPPPGALTTPDAPMTPVVHYQLSSGHVASLPQSSVPALMQQDQGAKQIPSPADGEVLVQLSSGHTATLPTTSLSALKQQDPNYKYIAGNTPAASKQLTPSFDAISAVGGPTTAAGTPLSPEMQQEGLGVSDILHGNFRQGASKIWDAEKPHVIQGSLLEKAMQKIDPTFQGSVTSADVSAHNEAYNALEHPVVDVAQFIDKSQRPVAKALAETAQSLTTPGNIAILYSTGGLGLVDNPQSLGFARRLISGGFSATAIGNAYSNYKGFREAVDKGDWSEAEYQITHAVTSGVLGVLAARDTVRDTSLPPNPFRNPKQTIAPTAEVAGETFSTRPMRSGVNQEAGTQAVQTIAAQTTQATGTTPTAQPASIRDVFNEAIQARTAVAQNYYKALDDASDNQWTANQNSLKNVRKEIQMKGGIDDERDASLNAKKIQLEWQQEQIVDKAVANGMPADVASQARSNWYAKSRLEDIQDIFNKKSNVSGPRPDMAIPGVKGLPAEQYNFKGIAKDLNAMEPADLTAALGKDQAQNLITAVNLAAKQGWATGKALAAIRFALSVVGAGHIGSATHLLQ